MQYNFFLFSEIIQLVKGYPKDISAPFRPYIDEHDGYLDINNLMIKCWAEDPIDRPDFNALKSIIRRINKYILYFLKQRTQILIAFINFYTQRQRNRKHCRQFA